MIWPFKHIRSEEDVDIRNGTYNNADRFVPRISKLEII